MAQSEDWIRFLLEQSNLPGPRANLELLWVVVARGDESFFNRCLEHDEQSAPTNTPGEFVAACGAAGIGKLICNGNSGYYKLLRKLASDTRWRVREGVAMALQQIGRVDFHGLIAELELWKQGNPYEKRAVVAGLCEPDLLINKEHAEAVLTMVFEVANALTQIQQKRDEPFKALRKGLGYGLSVAIVASPVKGKVLFEKLAHSPDRDIQWVVKENLKKNRLMRMDPGWVRYMQSAKH